MVMLTLWQRQALRAALAETLGTFWLVLGGCGSAVLAGNYPYSDAGNPLGFGLLGVSLAFGLTVVTMAYAVGHVSGGHFNPAVSVGLLAAGKFDLRKLPIYVLSQLVGAAAAGACIYYVASRRAGFELSGSNPLAVNGYGQYSPGGYPTAAVFATEAALTYMFLLVILGTTDERAPKGTAPLAIGLALTLIHMISIPVSNTSVNPARSTGVVFFAGRWDHWVQLWMFWVAPITGAVLGALTHRYALAPVDTEDDDGATSHAPDAENGLPAVVNKAA